MKPIIIIVLLFVALNLSAQDSLKAFGPIKFGMSKEEVKKAVKATEGMKLLTGQIHTDILGKRYWGIPEFDSHGFVAIMLNHYTGNWSALFRNYTKYQASDCEFDMNSLSKLFKDQYGEPSFYKGFTHPGFLEVGKRYLAGEWGDKIKIVQLWEQYINTVAYPSIVIILRKRAELNSTINNRVDEIQEKKTKELF